MHVVITRGNQLSRRFSLETVVCSEKSTGMLVFTSQANLLGACVLGDGLGSFRHGVLGQFSGQEQTDGGLDFPRSDGGPTVVVGQTGSLGGDALKDVVDEAVHDGHGLAGDAGVGVHLLQHFVDVDAVALPPPPFALLVTGTLGLGLAGGLLGSLGCGLGRHVDGCGVQSKVRANIADVSFI